MNKLEAFRANLISNAISNAVRTVDKISKKMNLIELDGLFKVKSKYATLCPKGKAFDMILEVKLSPIAEKWLKNESDAINWKTGAFILNRINELYGLELKLNEEWDIATLPDSEQLFTGFQLSVDIEDKAWHSLDEATQREIRIIFDAIDNHKYFMYSLETYFQTSDESIPVDTDYMNHLKARL